jgi:beta-barrel assembly-enhancing protease
VWYIIYFLICIKQKRLISKTRCFDKSTQEVFVGVFDQQGGGSSSSGFGGRILVAVGIALIGFIMYMNQTEINPITGEKQHVTLTPQQEIQLGLQSAPEMAAQMGGEISESDPRTQEVKRIGRLIVERSNAHKGPWNFQYHLLAEPKVINAFALPGGQIFITLGLLNKLQTEAQLAGVLAHETGHVIQRHSAQQLAKSQLGDMLVNAAAVGAASDPTHPSQGGAAAVMIAGFVNQMYQLRYSRHDELEADQWGLALMSEAGFDPRAMIQVMEILREAGAKSGEEPEMLLTHPHPDSRIREIKEYFEKHPPSPDLTEGRNLKDVFGRYRD